MSFTRSVLSEKVFNPSDRFLEQVAVKGLMPIDTCYRFAGQRNCIGVAAPLERSSVIFMIRSLMYNTDSIGDHFSFRERRTFVVAR